MDFAIYDVFCDEPYSGNQAAIVHSNGPFDSDRLAILAKELNLPETCAYWMSDGTPHMIFATSKGPIKACGHGLLAVLADVAMTQNLTTSKGLGYVVETSGSGIWELSHRGSRSAYICVKWPQLPTFSEFLPADETAQLLGVDGDRIRKDLPLAAFNSGITNGLVPLVDENELVRLQPNFCSMKSYFAEHGLDDLELYCVAEEQIAESGHLNIRSRNVFWYGVQEESATGTASLSLAAALIDHFDCSSLHVNVSQGTSRRGNITVRIATEAETMTAWLEGRVDLIASGTDLAIPG